MIFKLTCCVCSLVITTGLLYAKLHERGEADVQVCGLTAGVKVRVHSLLQEFLLSQRGSMAPYDRAGSTEICKEGGGGGPGGVQGKEKTNLEGEKER